jgi:hypothetical protein
MIKFILNRINNEIIIEGATALELILIYTNFFTFIYKRETHAFRFFI